MLKWLKPRAEPRSAVGYAIRSRLLVRGKEIRQVQFATDRYVVTEVERTALLFRSDREERYIVDRAQRRLVRIDNSAQQNEMRKVREAAGDVAVEEVDGIVEISGFPCAHRRFSNRSTALVLSGDVYHASVPGLERTALAAERRFDQPLQPFALPLAPDEVIVRSHTLALSAGFEQTQGLELTELGESPELIDTYDALLSLPVVGP
ncbi:MAG TPA: hypothetical protein VF615_05905 [Longimicrobiaceae bacterium]|jgi:hypothetical protein